MLENWDKWMGGGEGEKKNSSNPPPGLQIIFSIKPVVCQARDNVLPDIHSVWSDKNIFPHLFLKKLRE